MIKSKNKGVITTYVLVFGSIFVLLLTGILTFILLQLRQSEQKVSWNQALEIAEAGMNYYAWCLNNEAEDNCLTEVDIEDALGNIMGTAVLDVDSEVYCGVISSRTITSTGSTVKYPNVDRTIRAVYARESVASFAYLLNDNVWAGPDREIRGIYHSNGGIRMDGENQSLVASNKEEWVCTDSFGCDSCPTSAGCRYEHWECICPGVFTTTENSNSDLFDYPSDYFDFDGITIDLGEIKELVDGYPQQYYWPPVTDLNENGDGYHIKFLNDGTFEVWIITRLNRVYGYNDEEGWHYDYFVIDSEYRYTSPIAIDNSCPVIFVEDNLWLEGEVKGKITIASADLIHTSGETDIIIEGDINYTTLDGSDGLGVIAERNILIPPDSPNQLEMRGIYIAQKGRFGRNHYDSNIRDKLEVYGSIVSNGRVGTQWTSSGHIVSGYSTRENYNDSNLVYNPPPFISSVTSEFKIVNWEEVE